MTQNQHDSDTAVLTPSASHNIPDPPLKRSASADDSLFAEKNNSENQPEEKSPSVSCADQNLAEEVSAVEACEDEQQKVLAEIAAFKAKQNKRYFYRFVKRTFDIISSGLFLIAFSWLFLILAVMIKFSDGGKVIYRHPRVGKNGKPIHISKFRSMKPDADKLETMLTPEQLTQYKREFKVEDDPRVTRLGSFLRKTSLDELPQIWDIFVGRISVVGPRPLMKDEVKDKYGVYAEKLLSVKPGMIGWWAVNGRSNVSYENGERQALELYYVDNCSFGLDIKIIFKCIMSVIRRDGAR